MILGLPSDAGNDDLEKVVKYQAATADTSQNTAQLSNKAFWDPRRYVVLVKTTHLRIVCSGTST